jgi:hypothetical protein
MIDDHLRSALKTALEPLPGLHGGTAVVLATAGTPPALALLSTGDVHVEGDTVRVVTYRGSSAARRLGGSFSLLVPAGETAFRVEAIEAAARSKGTVELIEGRLAGVRPTAEPPWLLDMSFRPAPGADEAAALRFIDYWTDVRSWLEGGATGSPPDTTL